MTDFTSTVETGDVSRGIAGSSLPRPCESCVRRPPLAILCGSVLLATVLACPDAALSEQGPPGKGRQDSASSAFLFVLDHSGSMNAKMPNAGGLTRWQCMQKMVVHFLDSIPLGSHVWIAVFEGDAGKVPNPHVPFNTVADQAAAIARIKAIGPGKGGTAFYNTLGLAFRQARALRRWKPEMYIYVHAFTDGLEAECSKPPLNNMAALYKAYPEVQGEHEGKDGVRRFSIKMITDMADKNPMRIPVPIRLQSPKRSLENPKTHPQQTLPLQFCTGWTGKNPFVGKELKLKFDGPKDDSDVDVEVVGSYTFKTGELNVKVRVKNPEKLSETREYTKVLRITYPDDIKDHFVLPEGGTDVTVTFEKNKMPLRVLPEDGSTYAAGTTVLFTARTFSDAKVEWDFGDGGKAEGHSVKHVYKDPGEYTVKVKATRGGAVANKTLKVNIIDLWVGVDPLPFSDVVVGQKCVFTCTGRGPIKAYEWHVEGRSYRRDPDDPKKPSKSTFTYWFHHPVEKATIRVTAIAKETQFVSEPSKEIEVLPAPTLTVTSPKEGAKSVFGQSIPLVAEVSGPLKAVRWRIQKLVQDKPDKKPLFLKDVDVIKGKSTTDEYTPVEEKEPVKLLVTAVPVPKKELADDIIKDLTRTVVISVVVPERTIEITSPIPGVKLVQGEKTTIKARVSGVRIQGVLWTISDSAGKVHFQSDPKEPTPITDNVAELPFTMQEQASDVEAKIVAKMLLEGNIPQDNAKSDKVTVKCRLPDRKITIISPLLHEELKQGEKTTIKARVTGPKIQGVLWTIRDSSGSPKKVYYQSDPKKPTPITTVDWVARQQKEQHAEETSTEESFMLTALQRVVA